MAAFLGLVLFALIGYFLYCVVRFTVTVLRGSQDNRYGRRMVYSCIGALLMIAAIVIL